MSDQIRQVMRVAITGATSRVLAVKTGYDGAPKHLQLTSAAFVASSGAMTEFFAGHPAGNCGLFEIIINRLS